MTNSYEVMLLLNPQAGEIEEKELVGNVKKILQDGKFLSSTPIGRRKLAYPIQKHSEGYYLLINLDSSAKEVKLLANMLKSDRSILRYLIIHTKKIKED